MAIVDYCLKERKKDTEPGKEALSSYLKSILEESIEMNLQELDDHHPDDYMDEEEDDPEAPEEDEEKLSEYTETGIQDE